MDIMDKKRENIREFHKSLDSKFAAIANSPLEVFLEISNTCNIRCKMCATCWHGPNRFMSKNVFESAYPMFEKAIMLHPFGFGEPLLHKNFKEIITAAKAKSVYVDFFTNGTLLSEDMARFLIIKGVDRIIVSFDGATRETYEEIHKGAKYDKVVENLRFLFSQKRRQLRKKPELAFNFIAMQCNFHELPKLMELGASLGLAFMEVKSLVTYDFMPEMKAERKFCDPKEDLAIIESCREIARRFKIDLSLDQYFNSADKETQLLSEEELVQINIRRYIEAANGGPFCQEPFRTVYIKSDGNVKPCCFHQDYDFLGNVGEQSLMDIWAGERFIKFRQEIIDNKIPKACIPCIRDFHKPMSDNSEQVLWLISRPDVPQIAGTEFLKIFLSHPFEKALWRYLMTNDFKTRAKRRIRRMITGA